MARQPAYLPRVLYDIYPSFSSGPFRMCTMLNKKRVVTLIY